MILLREDINLLDEIFVMPGENPAMERVRELIAHKDKNNPEHIVGVSYDKTTMTTIDLTSVKQKALQRRLLKDLERGRVSVYDSTMLLPVYAAQYIDSVCRLPDRISETPLYIQEKAFEMLTVDQWNSYLNSYLADANFYKNYITLFDKTFVSPLSVQAKSFYNYLLTDSVVLGGETFYEISFYPKNEKHLVFKGKMLVDKKRHALVRIEATLLPSANINFVNGLNFLQRFQRVGDRYFYLSKMQSASLSFSTDRKSVV